jgi:hypothetical protein
MKTLFGVIATFLFIVTFCDLEILNSGEVSVNKRVRGEHAPFIASI